MKYNFVFMGLLCLMTFFCTTSCDKEKLEDVPIWLPGDQEFGFAKGKKNGKKFEASSGLFSSNNNDSTENFFLVMETISEEGYLRELIHIGRLEFRPGEFGLNSKSNSNNNIIKISYNTVTDGGDIAGDWYELIEEAKDNNLVITKIDTIQYSISGHFTGTFRNLDYNDKSNPKNPDEVKFSNISFEAKKFK